MPFNTHLKVQ